MMLGVEVQRQIDPEHSRETDGHVRIAGEIEVDLERIGEGAGPRNDESDGLSGVRRVENGRRILRELVGQQHLLREADDHTKQTREDVFGLHAVCGGQSELRHHLAVMQHRSGDQMRKIRDEQCVMHEVALANLAFVAIHEKCDLGEGEERDADGQNDIERADLRGRDGMQREIDVVDEEVRVLEVGEYAEVETDGRREPPATRAGNARIGQRRRAHRRRELEPEPVIDADGRDEQRYRRDAPVAVKDERGERQPRARKRAAPAGDEKECHEGHGKKAQQERVRIEQHGVVYLYGR